MPALGAQTDSLARGGPGSPPRRPVARPDRHPEHMQTRTPQPSVGRSAGAAAQADERRRGPTQARAVMRRGKGQLRRSIPSSPSLRSRQGALGVSGPAGSQQRPVRAGRASSLQRWAGETLRRNLATAGQAAPSYVPGLRSCSQAGRREAQGARPAGKRDSPGLVRASGQPATRTRWPGPRPSSSFLWAQSA